MQYYLPADNLNNIFLVGIAKVVTKTGEECVDIARTMWKGRPEGLSVTKCCAESRRGLVAQIRKELSVEGKLKLPDVGRNNVLLAGLFGRTYPSEVTRRAQVGTGGEEVDVEEVPEVGNEGDAGDLNQ